MKITYAYIEENLINLGRQWEQDSGIDGLSYSVVVKTANGRRFAHTFTVSQTLEWNEDTYSIVDWDDADMAKLDALKERVNKVGSINPDNGYWVEIEPVYGTQAWLDYAVAAA